MMKWSYELYGYIPHRYVAAGLDMYVHFGIPV
jgi:hypothetical protein